MMKPKLISTQAWTIASATLGIAGVMLADEGGGPILFQDSFLGSLNPAWAIVRADASLYSVQPTGLVVSCSSGDLYQTDNSGKNVFVIPNPASGDFTLTARLRWLVPPTQNWQQFALLAYNDDDNYVRAYYGHANDIGFYLSTELMGIYTGVIGVKKDVGSSDFWLRLSKNGLLYSQSYSLDGTNFVAVGSPATYSIGLPSKLGFVAMVDPSQSAKVLLESFTVQGDVQSPQPWNVIYEPISLVPVVNSVNNRLANCPTGSVILGDVPFHLLPPSAPNSWDAIAGTIAGQQSRQVMNLPVNIWGARAVDVLLNTSWGYAGSSWVNLAFVCDDGFCFTNVLTEGREIRDWLESDYVNAFTSTNTVQVYSAVPITGDQKPWGRIDKQHIALPAEFASRTLTNIVLTDDGVTGTTSLAYNLSVHAQRAFLYGLTVTELLRLRIQPLTNGVVLSWTTNAVGCTLAATTNLSAGAWIPVATPPAVVGCLYFVTNDVNDPRMFFRLQPGP